MKVKKENPRTCFSNSGIFSLNGLESFKLILFTDFFTSWKSHMVLDPSKKKKISSPELKISSTMKINRSKEGSGFTASVFLKTGRHQSTLLRSHSGIGDMASSTFCSLLQILFVYKADAHSGGQGNCCGTWSKYSILKDLDFFRPLAYLSWFTGHLVSPTCIRTAAPFSLTSDLCSPIHPGSWDVAIFSDKEENESKPRSVIYS